MTEEEAKTKWCPKYQVATSGGDISTYEMDNRPSEWIPDGVNEKGHTKYRRGPTLEQSCCIAAACMAWRWVEGGGPGPQHPNGPERSMDGYCGLAGKP